MAGGFSRAFIFDYFILIAKGYCAMTNSLSPLQGSFVPPVQSTSSERFTEPGRLGGGEPQPVPYDNIFVDEAEHQRLSSNNVSNLSLQEGPRKERSALWHKAADVADRILCWIDTVAEKFAALGEFIGRILGAVGGFVVALGVAAGSFCAVPIIWSIHNKDPGNDYLLAFIGTGADIGGAVGDFLLGGVGAAVGIATLPIGAPVTKIVELCNAPERSGYQRVSDDVLVDDEEQGVELM
ncbi:hypothetical protein ACUSIJ_21100 [Pseudochelatococcus sp. B33]